MENELKLPECPFYLRDREKFVECEGIQGDSVLRLRFRKGKSFQDHKDTYCCSMHYASCPIAQVLFRKYD